MKKFAFVQHLNWRILLLRVLVNAGALLLTAALVPNIYFVDRRLVVLLWMALALGVLNALVKPVVQFLVLPFIFATFGVVLVLINAGLLWLLSVLFPSLFAVNGLVWVLVGGLVMGLLSSFLEGLLGVTPPIVPETYGPLRQQMSSRPQGLPTILVQAAAAGEAPVTPVVSAGTTAEAPSGAPSSPQPSAGGADEGSEPFAPDPMVPATAVVEQTASVGAGHGAPGLAPVPDSTESEG